MSSTVLPVLLTLLCGLTGLHADVCSERGTPCHAVFGLDTAYENLFREPCRLHSICYSCGAMHSRTKQDCDDALRSAMTAACDTLSSPDICLFQADNVFSLETQVVGTNYFHDRYYPAPWCIEHGVVDCLPPTATPPSTSSAN